MRTAMPMTRLITPQTVFAIAILCALAVPAQAQTIEIEYYHLDALGSVRAVTNQSGAVIERHDYLPFGEEVSPPAGAQSRQFTGQERDAETGMDYFGARYFSAKRARFTTVDPDLGIETALVDPQRWNRYAYVGNRPTKVVDPDGRGWVAMAAKLASAAWKGQDYYSAVSTVVEGTATVFSMDGRVGEGDRLWAVGSVLMEISGGADIVAGARSASNGLGVIADAIKRHGNKVDTRPATLYEKYDKDGNFLKHGVTKHEDPSKRYTAKEIDGGTIVRTDRGPRNEMIRKERQLVETNPGPQNREPWAGKRRPE